MTESEAIKEIETSIELAKMCTQNFERTKEIEAYAMAIKALEKQIPKKAVKDGKWSYKCPCCGECAETDCGDSFYDYRLDYCNGCGQKLDWSDEE